jgi:hypothetical protein
VWSIAERARAGIEAELGISCRRTFLGGEHYPCKAGAVVPGEGSQSRHAHLDASWPSSVILSPSARNTPRVGTCASQLFAPRLRYFRRLSATPTRNGLLLPLGAVRRRRQTGRKAATCKRLHHAKRETGAIADASSTPIRWLMAHTCLGSATTHSIDWLPLSEPWGDCVKRYKERRGSPWPAAENGANHPMPAEPQSRPDYREAQFP